MKKLSLPILLLTTLLAASCSCSGNTPTSNSSTSTSVTPAPRKYGFYELKDGVDESTLQGSPWLNTSIIGMANKINKPSLKDDFFTASNYETLTTNTIPEGSTKGGGLVYKTLKLVNDRIDGIKKENQTFLALKGLVKSGAKTIAKAEVDAILSMSQAQYQSYLESVEFVRGSSAFVTLTNEKGLPTLNFYSDGTNQHIGIVSAMFVMAQQIDKLPAVLADIGEAMGYEHNEIQQIVTESLQTIVEFVQILFKATNDYKVTEVGNLDQQLVSSINFKKIVKELGMKDDDKIGYSDVAEKIAAYIDGKLSDPTKFVQLRNLTAIFKMFENRLFIGAESLKDLYVNKLKDTPLEDYEITQKSSLDEVADHFVNALFPQVIEKQYCIKYVTSAARTKVKDLINEVVNGFTNVLQNNEWLTSATKQKALEKMAAMRFEAFYSDTYEAYEPFSYQASDLLTTCDSYSEYFIKGLFDNVFSTDILHSGLPVTTVNAAYSPMTNSFRIFHGIVASFIDDNNLTREQLYGRIGVIIGHEISHGFDSNGSKYDKDGKKADWWAPEDAQKFQEKIDKMIAYYENNISVLNDGTKLIGRSLTGEIIADMGGMKNLIEMGKKINGFNWDEFFKNNSMFYDYSYTEDAVREAITSDPHPIGYLRVNVTMAQFDKFQETYNIKVGDGMYISPENRVAIW